MENSTIISDTNGNSISVLTRDSSITITSDTTETSVPLTKFFTATSKTKNTENLDAFGKIEHMLDTMKDIEKIYSLVNIQSEDIFITIAKTGEIVSLNKLLSDNARLIEEVETLKENLFT